MAAGDTYAADARRQRGRMLAAVLVDMDRLDDPAELINESPLFWEVAAKHASDRLHVRVGPPTGEQGVQAVIDAIRGIRRDRDRVPDDRLFDAFRPRVVR